MHIIRRLRAVLNLWQIGSSIYGTHINLRHPSVHRRQSRGIRPDIPLRPHPARHPVLEPVGSLQVPGRFLLGGGYRPSVRHERADPAQTHPLGGPSRGDTGPSLLSAGRLGHRFDPVGPAPRLLAGCRVCGAGDHRALARPGPPCGRPPADPGRRLFLQAGAGALAAAPLVLPATAPPGPEGPTRCEGSRCLSACR